MSITIDSKHFHDTGAKNKNNIIGNYNSIFTASSNNKIIRQNGSSGGIVRTVLVNVAVKLGILAAFISVAMSSGRPTAIP